MSLSIFSPPGARVSASALAVLLLSACGGDGGMDPQPWTVSDVTVTPSSGTVAVGGTVQLVATVQATGSPEGPTTWTSRNTSVATVDGSGLVTGEGIGEVFVIATAGGVSDSAAITVEAAPPPAPPAGLTASTLSHEEIELNWSDESDDETEFVVERDPAPAGGGTQQSPGAGASASTSAFGTLTSVGAGTTSFTDSDLDPGTTYRYRVSSCRNDTCSDPSNVSETTTDGVLVLQTDALPTAALGQSYEAQLMADGGGGNLQWTVTSGALPTGVGLDSDTGLLSGTPEEEGDFPFTVEVAARGQSDATELTLTVTAEPTVRATVFADDDRNGQQDGGEQGVEGMDVSFLDQADQPVLTVTTDADGIASAALEPGQYGISVDPSNGLLGDPLVVPGLVVDVTSGSVADVEVPLVPGARDVFGPAGGVLDGPGNLQVDVPDGALGEETEITVVRTDVDFDGETFPGVQLLPDGLELETPVEVTLPVEGGAAEAGQFFFVDAGRGEAFWMPTVVSNGDALLYTGHFSDFLFDGGWGAGGILNSAGTFEFALVGAPSRLAGSGTAGEFEAGVGRGVERWNRAFDALGATVVRDDGAADPFFGFGILDLGPCGLDDDPAGRADRLGVLTRDRTIYLNDNCLWTTSSQLLRDGTQGVAVEGAVVHFMGHLLGLPHHMGDVCEPSGGSELDACWGPPTMSVFSQGGLGPLWPVDLGLFQTVQGLDGDWTSRGVAGVRPADDWVEDQEVSTNTALPTPPGVVVFDGNGDPVPDVTVLFEELAGGGQLGGPLQVTNGSAHLGSWTLGSEGGENVVGASFFRPPSETTLNEGVGALQRFTATAVAPPPPPPGPVVEDFFGYAVGSFFRYEVTVVPSGGGDPSMFVGRDEVVGSTTEGTVTWFEIAGDGAIGRECDTAVCELGLDTTEGEILLRITSTEGTGVTTLLKEPIELGATWEDNFIIAIVSWEIVEVLPSLTVQGVEYSNVVAVRSTVSGEEGSATIYWAEGVGIVRIEGASPDGTVTVELLETGTS